jgi:flavodoxin
MKTLVIFDSQFGNTERLAEVISQRLDAEAPLWAADGAAKAALVQHDWNLLVVGAPTQNHTVSATMRALLQEVQLGSLKDAHVAVFDTRYRMASSLAGSAAGWIAARLVRAGARLVVSPESFFVGRDLTPPGDQRRHDRERLEVGEEERAQAWANALAAKEAPTPQSVMRS